MKEKLGNIRWFYSGLWYCLFFLLTIQSLRAQFTISEDFRGNGNPDIIIGDDAYLTSGNEDPSGAGWLRLTEAKTNQKGYAYVNKSFPSKLGVLVDFEYTMWRHVEDNHNGADGFTIFLFDANYGPGTFGLGAYGGSIGYANSTQSDPESAGLTGGYLGIGFDAYGNFVSNSEGKNGGSSKISPNSIVLRGPTISSNPRNTDTNKYLKGVTLTEDGNTHDALDMQGIATENVIDYNTPTSSRPSQDVFYRRVQAEILPIDESTFNIIVRWTKEYGGAFTELLSYTTNEAPPDFLKLGFAAATGGGFNYHEIRNMLVSTPGNLRVHKQTSKDVIRAGTMNDTENKVSFVLEITNDTATDLSQIDITDQFTDGLGNNIEEDTFIITKITTENFIEGTVGLPTVPINEGSFTGSVGLLANTTGAITVSGYLNKIVSTGNVLNNTVMVSSNEITDLDEENNTSTVGVTVMADGVDLFIEKTANNYCLDPTAGNSFTILVGNMGTSEVSYGGKKQIRVMETLPDGVKPIWISYEGWELVEPVSGNTYTFITPKDSKLKPGKTLPPIIYTIKNSNPFETTSEVLFLHKNNGNGKVDNLEPLENRSNNTVNMSITDQPGKPELVNPANSTIYYCQGDSASPMDSYMEKANYGNTLLWYNAIGGSPLSVIPTPNTALPGYVTYYVSQSNGNCESELTEIKIVVLAKPTPGEIAGAGEVCVNSVPGLLTNVYSGTGVGSEGLTYRWEYSIDNGLTWGDISGQVGESYQPDTIKTNMQYRRITIASIGDVLCESEPSNVITVAIKDCMILSNPMLPSKVKK